MPPNRGVHACSGTHQLHALSWGLPIPSGRTPADILGIFLVGITIEWEEQGHVSWRRSGLPASSMPSLAEQEMPCVLPFPTFPSPCVGYYMFIEASRPRVTGDKARLISPLYNITAKYYCVSFYYHMYGKHIGEYRLGTGSSSLDQGVREDLQPQLHQPRLQPAIWVGGSLTPVLKAAGWSSDGCPLPTA